MKNILRLFIIAIVCACLVSCIYRPIIQQGNTLTDCDISQLRPGLTEDQVVYLMGTPVLHNPFDSNHWYYVYTIKRGSQPRHQRYVILTFVNGVLRCVQSSPKMIVPNR